MSNLARIHSSQQQELTTTDSEPNIAPDLVTELREELSLEGDYSADYERQFRNTQCQVKHAQASKVDMIERLQTAEADAALQLESAAEANAELAEHLASMAITAQDYSEELSDAHESLGAAQSRIDDFTLWQVAHAGCPGFSVQ